MKTIAAFAITTVIAATISLAAIADSNKAEKYDILEGKESAIIQMKDLELDPAMQGVAGQLLWGNPESGASGLIAVFSPGAPQKMHKHTSSYHAIVIKGGVKHWEEGETEADVPLLGPGDSWISKGGIYHQESYPTDEETVVFMVYSKARDVQWKDK